MKKLIAVALFSMSASAFSAPPPNPPVFNLSVQTEDVNSALEHATKNIPTLEKGKRYEVHVEVKELPAQGHDANKAPKNEKEKPPLKDTDGKTPPPKPNAE